MNNVFYMLLLKKDIIKKEQIHKNNVTKLNISNDKSRKYKVNLFGTMQSMQ